MRVVLAAYRPQIVLHAAAHKHVPLLESNVAEAVRNNVLATRTLGELAVAAGGAFRREGHHQVQHQHPQGMLAQIDDGVDDLDALPVPLVGQQDRVGAEQRAGVDAVHTGPHLMGPAR